MKVVDTFPIMDWSQIKQNLETLTGFEGYVVQFESGEMVKAKTEWYLELHRTTVFMRERDIVSLILNEQIDDIKSAVVSENSKLYQQILEIETKVLARINLLQEEVEKIVSDNIKLSRKEMALKFNKNEAFSLIMKKYSGTEPDYLGFFKKHWLSEYSLIQL